MENYNSIETLFSNAFSQNYDGPKYVVLANSIVRAIEGGMLGARPFLPSITNMSKALRCSRSTVEKSFNYLSGKGILLPVSGKGYFINTGGFKKAIKVCLIMNKLNNRQTDLFQSLTQQLGEEVLIAPFVYHNNFDSFRKIIKEVKGTFSHYLIVPHFQADSAKAASLIAAELPAERVIFIDRRLPAFEKQHSCILEDFEADLFERMESLLPKLKKYHTLQLIFPEDGSFSPTLKCGFTSFASHYRFNSEIVHNSEDVKVEKGTVYFCLTDHHLANMVEKIADESLIIGKHVGVLAYTDNPVAKYIAGGITSFSSDYRLLSQLITETISGAKVRSVKLPFKIISRKSL